MRYGEFVAVASALMSSLAACGGSGTSTNAQGGMESGVAAPDGGTR